MERNQFTTPNRQRRRLDINRPPPINIIVRNIEINKKEPENEDDICKNDRRISFSDTSPLRFMRRIDFN